MDQLSDLTHHKANLQVSCPCGATHIFDAQRLNRYAMMRGWNTHLEVLGGHLRCQKCRRRNPYLRAVVYPPTPADPFPKREEEWKALWKRMRG